MLGTRWKQYEKAGKWKYEGGSNPLMSVRQS